MVLKAVAQSASAAAGQLPGTATNDSASAGNVGEYIFSTVLTGAAVSLVTGTGKTITSISLTAGDWDVWGVVAINSATSTTTFVGSISLVDNTLPISPGSGSYWLQNVVATNQNQTSPVGMIRVSIAVTTPVYLIALSNFTGSANTAYGFIGARRAR